MAGPLFLLQIVDAHTKSLVTRFPGGGKPPALGTLEADCIEHLARAIIGTDLVDALIDEILKRPVGLWRTQATVEEAIREGLNTILPVRIRKGLTEGLQTLKNETSRLV